MKLFKVAILSIYCLILFVVPIIIWVLLLTDKHMYWDTPKYVLLSILTFLGWFASVFVFVTIIYEHIKPNRNHMKSVLPMLLLIAFSLVSCSKSKDISGANRINNLPQVQQRLNIFQDAQVEGLKLGVAVNGDYRNKDITVKMVHYDYNNGHTPLLAIDSVSYPISGISRVSWSHLQTTNSSYSGVMKITITMDSVGTSRYTRDVLLTDSLGYIANLDTASTVSGFAGSCSISNAVPKSWK